MTDKTTKYQASADFTTLSPVPGEAQGFYQRFLLAGLRIASGPTDVVMHPLSDGMAISAIGTGATGYLIDTEGLEVPESDLTDFLLRELGEGDGLNVFGRYSPGLDMTVESKAHFRFVEGRFLTAEERFLIRPDGVRQTLRSRSDISFQTVIPLDPARRATTEGAEP